MQALAHNVTVVPARRKVGSQRTAAQVQKTRVAACCRVSTDSEEQETSYEAQVQHYTDYIRSRPDWEFVEIYERIPGADFKGWFRVYFCFTGSLTHAYMVLSILIRVMLFVFMCSC